MKNHITGIKPLAIKHNIMKIQKGEYKLTQNSQCCRSKCVDLEESKLHKMSRKSHRKFTFERSIDLHGLTRQEAFEALLDFFIKCRSENIKNVIVITGGNELRKSVLRTSFQKWVNESFGRYVASCSNANIWHGGEGAFYLILKKI